MFIRAFSEPHGENRVKVNELFQSLKNSGHFGIEKHVRVISDKDPASCAHTEMLEGMLGQEICRCNTKIPGDHSGSFIPDAFRIERNGFFDFITAFFSNVSKEGGNDSLAVCIVSRATFVHLASMFGRPDQESEPGDFVKFDAYPSDAPGHIGCSVSWPKAFLDKPLVLMDPRTAFINQFS